MRDDWDNNNFSRHKRRKKAKRRTLHRSIKLFLIVLLPYGNDVGYWSVRKQFSDCQR